MERRQAIATLEQQACRDNGDQEGDDCWGFILYAVAALGNEGMSDEEDGEEEGEAVKEVLDLNFRRQEFRSIFRFVDSARDGIEWDQSGRKFKKRVDVSRKTTRRPRNGTPSVFLNPDLRAKAESNNDELEAALSR